MGIPFKLYLFLSLVLGLFNQGSQVSTTRSRPRAWWRPKNDKIVPLFLYFTTSNFLRIISKRICCFSRERNGSNSSSYQNGTVLEEHLSAGSVSIPFDGQPYKDSVHLMGSTAFLCDRQHMSSNTSCSTHMPEHAASMSSSCHHYTLLCQSAYHQVFQITSCLATS